ncbi:response regulator transcription factor [Nocardioides sp. SR21]|uniref:response regulator transcription factor n=1 Tax=Nocardioides sp. SR21 TaxID=2919501 RepID=UPI001FAA7CB5|nr:response regulator transcription factor [Nocardioides sp. SR21]
MPAGIAKVAVLSPHPVVVEGFSAMLSRHHDRVEVIDLPTSFDDLEPDVVLYDVAALADGDGVDLDELVKATASVVLAVARDLRPDLLGRALSRGVDGFIPLGAGEEELMAGIDSAMTGWQAGDPGPDPVVGSSTSEQRSHRLGADVGLSVREARVLSLIAQGRSNDEIAAEEFLSVNTVKSYIRTAYRKIGVHTRSQAVVWAVQHGVETDAER